MVKDVPNRTTRCIVNNKREKNDITRWRDDNQHVVETYKEM